jgi:hypothetical protein
VTDRAGPAAARPAPAAWTRAPEPAARYPLLARLSDMVHGWLDGRNGIPQLPEIRAVPGAGDRTSGMESGSEPDQADEAAAADQLVPADDPPKVGTPRIEVLSRLAGESMAHEQARLIEDRAVLERESARFLATRDALSRELALVEGRLQQASGPLTDEQREDRRIAEHDSRARPITLIRARRDRAWERRLGTAEQQRGSVLVRFTEAERQVRLQEELIRDRVELAQADARRQFELALRRIATYAQQLVRTHQQGAELNRLLLSDPVGPQLPGWITEPDAGMPGAGERAVNPHRDAGDPPSADEKGGA